MSTSTAPPAPPWSRRQFLALTALGLSVAAVAGLWLREGSQPAPAAPPISRYRADFLTRRTEVVFADTQAFWAAYFTTAGKRYVPARIVFFSGALASPCAGAKSVTGPFYCAETGSAAFDLDYLETLEKQLRDATDRGGSLLIGQIASEHALDRLGAGSGPELVRALRVDCLTGIWAKAASARLGALEAERYEWEIKSARRTATERSGQTRGSVAINLFATGKPTDRAAAYAAGYRGAAVSDCLTGNG